MNCKVCNTTGSIDCPECLDRARFKAYRDEIDKLKAELAEAKVNRDAWVRSLLVERDSANADADLLGREVNNLESIFGKDWRSPELNARPTAAARVKGGA